MASQVEDRVYDELLCFLGDSIFQIPVRTFMDENCLIFDPSIQLAQEHQDVHGQYKKLIDSLLEGFCQDAKITPDQAVSGVNKLSQIPDLREVFQALFEQVLAATDFDIFCQVMIKRNIMIQEQVLAMIIAATGQVPTSFQSGKKGGGAKEPPVKGGLDNEEEDILQKIMQQSKDEQRKMDDMAKREEADLKKTLELSLKEAQALEESRRAMQEAMEKMVLAPGAPSPSTASSIAAAPLPKLPMTTATAAAAASKPTIPKQPVPIAPAPKPQKSEQMPAPKIQISQPAPVSGSQAASEWLQSAQAEVGGQSAAHSAIAESLSKLSPDELKKRQEFLNSQRDKLLAMKKDARQKNLGVAVKSQPQRPQSARAARSAMNNQEGAETEEDQRKIAMRKAIAEKLRREVINQ